MSRSILPEKDLLSQGLLILKPSDDLFELGRHSRQIFGRFSGTAGSLRRPFGRVRHTDRVLRDLGASFAASDTLWLIPVVVTVCCSTEPAMEV